MLSVDIVNETNKKAENVSTKSFFSVSSSSSLASDESIYKVDIDKRAYENVVASSTNGSNAYQINDENHQTTPSNPNSSSNDSSFHNVKYSQAINSQSIKEKKLRQSVSDELAKLSLANLNPYENLVKLNKSDYLEFFLCSFTLFPIRVVLLVMLGIVAALTVLIFTIGIEENSEKPIRGWRLAVKRVMIVFARCTVFLAGFHRVIKRGKRASPNESRILVLAPHTTFMDTMVIFALDLPCVIMAKIPFFAFLAKSIQAIIVNRRDPNNKVITMNEIKRRADPALNWPQLAIFPEGTTTNGSALVSFKTGT